VTTVLLDVPVRDGAPAPAIPAADELALEAIPAEPIAQVRAERVAALDGLRGLMAWAVALYHFGLLTHAFRGAATLSSVVTVLGLHSVEAFFMVSGFCLFHLHGEMGRSRTELRRFYLQRFLRLAPVFYLVLALNFALQEQAGPPLSWHTFLENVTFTFGLHHPNHALVTGGWSIGLEVMFYASFPFLAALFRSPVALAVGALAAIGLAWSYSANDVESAADAARFNAYVLMQNHAFAFLVGGLIAKLRPLVVARVALPLACALFGTCAVFWIRSHPLVIDHFEVVLGLRRAQYVAAAALCVALAACTHVASARLRVMLERFGELSYPVYLLHPLAWVLCRGWLPSGTSPAMCVAAAILTTLVLAVTTTRFLERPVRRVFTAAWLEKRA
jgi:exopolysaccharide production protein ExoZ